MLVPKTSPKLELSNPQILTEGHSILRSKYRTPQIPNSLKIGQLFLNSAEPNTQAYMSTKQAW
jgi:hypothetical protein